MALAETLGLRKDQVMACGDSGNDLEMIRMAGLGVAMANAFPEVKAAADVITLDNNHDGVAAAIETLSLIHIWVPVFFSSTAGSTGSRKQAEKYRGRLMAQVAPAVRAK